MATTRLPADAGLWVARTLGRRAFSLLSGDDVIALSAVLRAVPHEPGLVLFRQGEPARAAHIVRDGEVELVHLDGNRKVTLGIAREGEVIGDVSLLSEQPYRFSAIARTAGSSLRIGADDLRILLKTHPAISLRWLITVVERMDRTTQRLLEVTSRNLRSRILAFLVDELVARGDTSGEAVLRISQETLASIVGASRQSVNRALRELRAEGLVRAGYGRITVPDPDRLRAAS